MRENDRLKHSLKTSASKDLSSARYLLSDEEYKDLQYQLEKINTQLGKASSEVFLLVQIRSTLLYSNLNKSSANIINCMKI